jgi:D-3-phosphoglycerate dehydrogenase / 2-oxoglutarate reductase
VQALAYRYERPVKVLNVRASSPGSREDAKNRSYAGIGRQRRQVAGLTNTEMSNREQEMSKFKVVTPKGASFTVAGGGYAYEKEALDPIGAEIVEAPANEADFIAAARTADAIYAKGMRISKAVIDALENCKVITLGSVGVDSVDVKAATARGIPVTNIPDTFIEEVADHAMMLLLAGFRRLVEQDKMVRSGRWTEGRPVLLKMPRLMGQTLGFISFGRVARAVAKRAAPFGLRMMAYDPFIAETLISDHGVLPATLSEVLSQSDFVSMHAPARPEVHHMLGETHFRQMKPSAIFINTGRGATVNEEALIKALQEGWIAHAALDVLEKEPPSHNNPMLSMENVTLTAHVASASARFDEARKRRVGFELSLVLSGMWPVSCVNPSVLQTTSLRRWQPVSMERGPNS